MRARGEAGTMIEKLLGFRPRGPRRLAVAAQVTDRVVVVTGASRGIGAEVARRLGDVGAHVVLIARSAPALETVAAEVRDRGGEAHVIPCDLRDPEAAEDAAGRVLREAGTPAVVISNAGHSIHRTLAQYVDRGHDVTRTIGVNYVGPVALLRVLAPAMARAGAGHIVAVSSVSVDLPSPGWSVYGASKTAFDAWLAAVAAELAPRVTTTIVRLPLVRTAMSAPTAAYAALPAMRPLDAAKLVARAIVRRPRLISPWWARAAAVLLAVRPGILDAVLRAGERRVTR